MSDPVEQAFRRHYRQVFRYVRRRTGDDGRAEDLTQEVFAAATAALPVTGDDDSSVLPWLYTVARRRFADEARRRNARPSVVPLTLAAGESRDFGPAVAESLRVALTRLPDGQREVVVLKLLRGLPFTEVAARLELTEAASKMRFTRALSALRAELEKEGIEP